MYYNGTKFQGNYRDFVFASDVPIVTYFWFVRGCQTRMVSGTKCYANDGSLDGPDGAERATAAFEFMVAPRVTSRPLVGIAEAVERVRHFAFVGTTESFADAVRLLYDDFGDGLEPSDGEVGPGKKLRVSKAPPIEIRAQQEALRGYSDVADEAVYAEVRRLFEARLGRFHAKLAKGRPGAPAG